MNIQQKQEVFTMKENRVKKWKRQTSLLLALVLTIGAVFTGKTDVSAASKKVSLNITNFSLSVGKSKKLKVSGAKKVKWSTSKKSVASVTKNGKIKAKKAGMATITAKVSGKKLRCNVVVHRPSSKKKDILIVYFSQSGTTRAVAKKIQKLTGGDLLRIQEKNKYPTDYDKLTAQGKRELNQNARPGITTVVGNLKDYDTVFIGYPKMEYQNYCA